MKIIAIDPGYDRVGWAVGQQQRGQLQVLGYGCIQTDANSSLIERYAHINRDLDAILAHFTPDQAAIESLFFAKNQTTAMHVAEARGIIISCVMRAKLAFFEYTPLQIKQAVTGYGKADKAAVAKMVQLQLKLPFSIDSKTGKPAKILDDTLDALGLLITHTASAGIKNRV